MGRLPGGRAALRVGMVAVVSADEADAVVRDLRAAGEQVWIAGNIVPGDGTVELGDNGATG